MRNVLFAAALVGAIAVAFAWAAQAGGPPGPVQDRVYGGGTFGPGCSDGAAPFCIPRSRAFSVLAASNPEGGPAYGTFRYGIPETGLSFGSGRVTCLRVSGGDAVIGGVWTDGANAGLPFIIMFQDTGDAGSPTHDRSTALFLEGPADPPADCSELASNGLGTGYFTLAGGDLAVEDH